MLVVVGSTLAFAALVALVMRHAFGCDRLGLILLCSCLRFRVWIRFLETEVNVFYVSIRTSENYQFDRFRTAGVTGNAIINSQGQEDNPVYVQPEMKFRSPPGHFHHEPPLVLVI